MTCFKHIALAGSGGLVAAFCRVLANSQNHCLNTGKTTDIQLFVATKPLKTQRFRTLARFLRNYHLFPISVKLKSKKLRIMKYTTATTTAAGSFFHSSFSLLHLKNRGFQGYSRLFKIEFFPPCQEPSRIPPRRSHIVHPVHPVHPAHPVHPVHPPRHEALFTHPAPPESAPVIPLKL